MKSGRKGESEKGAFDMVEEVFHLLRLTPLSVLASYYVGALPFILALLYFWTDMSKGIYAYAHLAGGSLSLALLFVWMKVWQAVFCRCLLATLCGEATPKIGPRPLLRSAMRQTFTQATGLIILPLGILITPAFGWTYAFYQNMLILDGEGSGRFGDLVRSAANQAKRWPQQNFILIWLLSPYMVVTAAAFYLAIMPIIKEVAFEWTQAAARLYGAIFMALVVPLCPFGVVVALNIASALYFFPQLLKMLFGVETVFAQNPGAMVNGAFFAVVCGLTYLCLDPLMKTAYVLRCFYGASVRTGQDIKVELRHMAGKAVRLILAATVLAGLLAAPKAMAQESTTETPAVSSSELSVAVQREMDHARYSWRLPRERRVGADEGVLNTFARRVQETLERWWEGVKRWLDKVFGGRRSSTRGGGFPFHFGALALGPIFYIFLALLILMVGAVLWRAWRLRDETIIEAEAIEASEVPDIEDETTTADQLPEEGWMAMAHELIDQGEFRLALRAIFLASLAHLAEGGFIAISLYKTNLDYQGELKRRAHVQPELMGAFTQSAGIYESVWYGTHEPTRKLLDNVIGHSRKLRTYVE